MELLISPNTISMVEDVKFTHCRSRKFCLRSSQAAAGSCHSENSAHTVNRSVRHWLASLVAPITTARASWQAPRVTYVGTEREKDIYDGSRRLTTTVVVSFVA